MANFEYDTDDTLHVVEKQTYLGLEITSSGRFTYARKILSKKAIKVLLIINQSFSNSDTAAFAIMNKLSNVLININPCYFMLIVQTFIVTRPIPPFGE